MAAFIVQSMDLEVLVKQIKAAKNGLTLKATPEVIEQLKKRPDVTFVDNKFFYHWPVSVLIEKIRKSEFGLTTRQLFNNYHVTSDDIEKLKITPELLIINDKDDQMTFFHRPPVSIHIDEDIKELWKKVQIPPQALKEIDEYTDKFKHEEEVRIWRTRNEAAVQAKKEKKGKKNRPPKRKKKVSNSHLASNPEFAFLFT